MAVLFNNNASSTLGGSASKTDTGISVASGDGGKFPAPSGGDWFPITIEFVSGSTLNREICHCKKRVGDTLTVSRGEEGTPAHDFPVGAVVELRLTALALNERLNANTVDGHSLGSSSDQIPLNSDLPDVKQSPGTSKSNILSQDAISKLFHSAGILDASYADALTSSDAGRIVVVNASGTGYTLGPTISKSSDADTVVQRDGSGNVVGKDIVSTG